MRINNNLIEDKNGFKKSHIIKYLANQKKRFYKNAIWAFPVWLACFLVYFSISYHSSQSYSLILGLNYPQAAQGKYPNGSNFSPSDIISSSVLDKVWMDNQLGERGVELSIFRRSFTAIPLSGEISLIESKYRAALASKNISRIEIEKMEADYRAEIAQASTKAIKLTMDSGSVDYSTAQASKILNDVALTWNRSSIERLGVLMTPTVDSLTLNGDIKSEAPIVIINYLIDFSDRAKNIINIMRSNPNSNSYRDEKLGVNLGGLSAKLSEISDYQIDHLDVMLATRSNVTEVELMQTKHRIEELHMERKVLMMKAESVRRALADYSGDKSQEKKSDESKTRTLEGSENSGIQFNNQAMNKLFNLAMESKDALYRQQLTEDRLQYENIANDFNLRIARLERRLGYMQSRGKTLSVKGDESFKAQANRVWGNLQEVVDAIARIQKQARQDFTGQGGLLYSQLSEVERETPGKWKLVKIGLLSLSAVIILAFLFTMIQLLVAGLGNQRAAQSVDVS